MSKKVIVTGGAGFIGSHLVEELTSRGYYVTVLDDLSMGKMENIGGLLSKGNVDFVQGSVTDFPLLLKLFQNAQYVFHQAAISSVPQSVDSPQLSHETNITGTLNVLLAARDNRVQKVVCASSCAVYGDAQTLPNREDMLPSPQSPYAVTKLADECYCQVFYQVYGLPTVCLRYFNVYGPRQTPNSQYATVITKFMERVSGGRPPIIFGDGEQTRDFIFVTDIVEANIMAAESDATGVFNIGRGDSITINQLAELIIRLIGRNVESVHEEPRPGDIKNSLADISKALSFGYDPKHSLEEGLRLTIEWYKENSRRA